MADNGYLNDPKLNYDYGTARPLPTQHRTVTPSPNALRATTYAGILFILSFVIFFTVGIHSSPAWVVSMIVGIIAHIVAFKGVFDAKGSAIAIVVAVISAIPAYLSCCFLFIALVAHISRAT